jgi:hypothetical protein
MPKPETRIAQPFTHVVRFSTGRQYHNHGKEVSSLPKSGNKPYEDDVTRRLKHQDFEIHKRQKLARINQPIKHAIIA